MARAGRSVAGYAVRCEVVGTIPDGGLRDATLGRARELGVRGWVRTADRGGVLIHVEGSRDAVEALVASVREAAPPGLAAEIVTEERDPEGHEQFAVRGVSAGRFVVVEAGPGFELSLEVGGGFRTWALPKAPSMDPAAKRIAFESGDAGGPDEESGPTWDAGEYEQGGRVAWPVAIERGHAVFVLHGAKLSGGFALQRIGSEPRARWLLVKRRDEHARRRP